jgi:hypothetical protein
LIASGLVGETAGQGDPFLADKAWWYVTLLTFGYMISRGLAKARPRRLSSVSARAATVIDGLAITCAGGARSTGGEQLHDTAFDLARRAAEH